MDRGYFSPGSALVSVKLLSHVQNSIPLPLMYSWNNHHRSGTVSGFTLSPSSTKTQVWSLALPVLSFCTFVWVFYGFLPHSKSSVQVRQRGDSKLPVGMNVSVSGCLPICVQPAVDWRPAQCPATRPVHVGKGCSPRCARRGLGRQGEILIYSVLI